MAADRFEDVSRVVAASFPARALRHVIAGLRAATPRSRAGAVFMGARAGLAAIAPSERVRLAGVVVLTADVTHDILVRFLPEIVRPGAPRALRVAVGLIGLALMLMAPALERAWRTSGIRGTWLSQWVR